MYRYDDANWQDKLTAYNNVEFAYDAIGNLKNDGTWTYTWQAGRHLRKMTKSGMTVEFKYAHNGLRTQKKVTEGDVVTTTNYYLHGKLVTHMTVGSDKLHFFYDNQQRPAKVNFNGTIFTYLHNLQGDIVGIVDGNGNLVVEYRYDAWGKLLSVSGSKKDTLGKLNPFRYRGYVYDEETGLYYLCSRYYTPEVGRFINADLLENSEAEELLALNLYCYVLNNPILDSDPDGTFALQLTLGGIFATTVKSIAIAAVKHVVPVIATAVTAIIVPLAVKTAKKAAKTLCHVGLVAVAAVSYAKERVKERIGRRKSFNTRKKAKEAAEQAGRGKIRHDPCGHPPKVNSPHFHPDVPNPKPGQQTPHMPSPHDHYYYPKGR